VTATTVLLVGRIHVDLLRVCASRCPGCWPPRPTRSSSPRCAR